MKKISHEVGSGNIFADIGFSPVAAEELAARSDLIGAIKGAVQRKKLT